MHTLTLLEKLATHAHYRIPVQDMISEQTPQIQIAFQTNDSSLLKTELGSSPTQLADRTTVVQL